MIHNKGEGEKKTHGAPKPAHRPRVRADRPKRGAHGAHQPTEQDRMMVKLMAASGFTQDQARAQVGGGLSENTFRKHYGAEWQAGADHINAIVAGNLFKRACGTGKEAVTAAIFWMKARAGWRDNPSAPIKVDATADLPTKGGKVRFTLKIGERSPDDGA